MKKVLNTVKWDLGQLTFDRSQNIIATVLFEDTLQNSTVVFKTSSPNQTIYSEKGTGHWNETLQEKQKTGFMISSCFIKLTAFLWLNYKISIHIVQYLDSKMKLTVYKIISLL